MRFCREVEERLIFDDGAANRAAKLVADEVILRAVVIREPAIGRQRLNAVVLKERTVPLIGPALEHRVSHETAGLAVFRRWRARDHAVLFDSVGRDAGVGSSGPVKSAAAAETLVVVAETFHHEVAAAAARTIDGRPAIGGELSKGCGLGSC